MRAGAPCSPRPAWPCPRAAPPCAAPRRGRSQPAARRGARAWPSLRFAATPQVRVGVIGVGERGPFLLELLLGLEGVAVRAVCDIVREKAARSAAAVEQAGQPAPAVFSAGERDFENLCRRDDLDLVVIATPWEWHVPMAVAAMEAGHHAAVEVPAAVTVRRVLAAGRHLRAHAPPLRDAGELLLRPQRAAGAAAGAGRPAGRDPARRGRLHPRPAQDPLRQGERGPLAARLAHPPQRQPLPHPRPGPGRPLHGHQPRRPLRAPGLDEQRLARPADPPGQAPAPTTPAAARATCAAT